MQVYYTDWLQILRREWDDVMTRDPRITDERFVKIWNNSPSVAAVSERTGYAKSTLIGKVNRLRGAGYCLKDMLHNSKIKIRDRSRE